LEAFHKLDEIVEACSDCQICVESCEFLSHYCTSARELAERLRRGEFREAPKIAYSCNLCGLCEQVCPLGLNAGEMFMELRKELVKEGLGPLPGHRFVAKNQDFVLSEAFTLAIPHPNKSDCKRVFFPGCSLPGYSPSLTIQTYHHLRQRLPGTGIVLGCCGRQTLCLGDEPKFEEVFGKTLHTFEGLGISEIIVACPECYETFKEYAPHLTLTFLSDALLKAGLPEGLKGRGNGRPFSLHDSCSTRHERAVHESVRALVKTLGYEVEEMAYSKENTRCCGLGGMVSFANPKLAGRMTKTRAEEASHDVLTYCAGCREALGAHKPALHILDLIFTPDLEEARKKSPITGQARRENQAEVKRRLEKDSLR